MPLGGRAVFQTCLIFRSMPLLYDGDQLIRAFLGRHPLGEEVNTSSRRVVVMAMNVAA